jgi:hypothetical protein
MGFLEDDLDTAAPSSMSPGSPRPTPRYVPRTASGTVALLVPNFYHTRDARKLRMLAYGEYRKGTLSKKLLNAIVQFTKVSA